MKARTNLILLFSVTIALFVYAFLQPIFIPTNLSNEFHINPLAFIFGCLAIIVDIKQYRRIKGHYKHLEFNKIDPKCPDCITKEKP